jgi:hypothetical protein
VGEQQSKTESTKGKLTLAKVGQPEQVETASGEQR